MIFAFCTCMFCYLKVITKDKLKCFSSQKTSIYSNLMHGRCCCCLACFFPDIPRDVCAVTGGPDLIIHFSYMHMYHYLMTTCQISSFVVNIFTLIFEVQYTLVFKDVVVKFRKQYFITILRH